MLLLRNTIQPYAWGPVDGLADLLGVVPTGGPQAELWVGGHDRGPSVIAAGPSEGRTIGQVMADDPRRWWGTEAPPSDPLPFLLKLLCIEQPLSVQAHPSTAQAEAGYAREDAAEIPIDAPHRTYRDASAKPEMLVALIDTWVLCGFRAPEVAADLISGLGVVALDPLVERLRSGGVDGGARLRSAVSWLVELGTDDRQEVSRQVLAAVPAGEGDVEDPLSWVALLARTHPSDPFCVAPLLLELVHLRRGDAVHLPAGNLHAYLRGAGVEIMASSDNVLRGGLTEKHVDADELLSIVRFTAGSPAAPTPLVRGRWTVYDADESTFVLATTSAPGEVAAIGADAPMVLLAVGGSATVTADGGAIDAEPGEAVLVEPGTTVSVAARGSVWCATAGGALRFDGDGDGGPV